MPRLLFFVIGVLVFVAVRLAMKRGAVPRIVSRGRDEAFIVSIKLSGDQFGGVDEREGIFRLEDALCEAIDRSNAGEFDGNEFGGGFAVLYMYGPSAIRLAKAVMPVLKAFRVPAGSYAVKRYGKPEAKEERVELS
jgi:hypothetical protein